MATLRKILVPLAEGFEEIEAIVPIDVWRRAGYEVTVVGLQSGPIRASRQTVHLADTLLANVIDQEFDVIYLPGGRPGADNLGADNSLCVKLQAQFAAGKWIAAICAAPMVLDKLGVLDGKNFTCHESISKKLKNTPQQARVVVDDFLVTASGAGASMELALEVVSKLSNDAKASLLSEQLINPEGLFASLR